MLREVIERAVEPRTLSFRREEIYRAMGCREGDLGADIIAIVEQVIEELLAVAKPRYCYTIVDRLDFKCGKIIADALAKGERYALIISSLGEQVDELIHSYRESDIMRSFVADAFASELAESHSRSAIEQIELREGELISNSYSPGYCGWDIREQRKLFSYFEGKPCGIELTDSCLMLPIKSISAVVAIGSEVVKAPYGCDICSKIDCYKKKR